MKNTNFADLFKSAKQIRLEKGLTLEQVSAQTKIPVYLLNKFEEQGLMINWNNLISIAQVYQKKLCIEFR